MQWERRPVEKESEFILIDGILTPISEVDVKQRYADLFGDDVVDVMIDGEHGRELVVRKVIVETNASR